MKRVFVSSSLSHWGWSDMRHRAKSAIIDLQMDPILLEERWGYPRWSRESSGLTQDVAEAIEKSDVFVLLITPQNFPSIPYQKAPCSQLEGQFAVSIDKPILVFSTTDFPAAGESAIEETEEIIGVVSHARAVRRIRNDSELSAALTLDLEELANAKIPPDSPGFIVLPPLSPLDIHNLVTKADELEHCASREFEFLVARLLEADGWDVELVARNNSPGPDIIAVSRKILRGTSAKMIVECKRHKPGHPVDINVVRKVMYWVNEEYRATFGMIATTSTFTRDAVDERNRFHLWRLDLKDQENIVQWIRRKPVGGWGGNT